MMKHFNDAFAFNLRAYPSVLPLAAMPVLANNPINDAISERIENAKVGRGESSRSPLANATPCVDGRSF